MAPPALIDLHPRRWRFAPAFLLPLVIFACGWFWGPPLLFPDTATGMLAWRNFTAGGAWNTILEPSAANLALNVAHPITWWSPGQYVPLGLLTSSGLSLGASILLLALLSAWSLTAGLVCLARALGAPETALPWLALAAAGSWHTLFPFGMFIGGEVTLIALWPWIFLAAWRLRDRPVLLVLLLPPLLVLGSFAKHSFAISALGLLLFLWLESIRGRPRSVPAWITASVPLVVVGLLYILGRHFLLPSGPNPSDPGRLHRTAAESLGFSAAAPLLAATGGGSLAGRIFMLQGLRFETAWQKLAPILLLLAPAGIAFYAWLALNREPLLRAAGVISLVTVAALALLLWRGGDISLDDRHFRLAGVLLLGTFSVAAVAARSWIRLGARSLLILVIAFGVGAALQRHHSLRLRVYAAGNGASIADLPPAAQAELRRIDTAAAGSDAILYLSKAEFSSLIHSARIVVTDAVDHNATWFADRPYRGRVSSLTLVLPADFDQDGRGQALRLSFLDYPAAAWNRRSVAGWDFWQAAAAEPSP